MKKYHKYLLDTIRSKGERNFVKTNQKSDPKLAKDENGNDNKTFSGAGVSELEGAKTLHVGNLPGEDATQYEAWDDAGKKTFKKIKGSDKGLIFSKDEEPACPKCNNRNAMLHKLGHDNKTFECRDCKHTVVIEDATQYENIENTFEHKFLTDKGFSPIGDRVNKKNNMGEYNYHHPEKGYVTVRHNDKKTKWTHFSNSGERTKGLNDVYRKLSEDVSPEIKAKLAKNKENKKFTVHLKHLITGKSNSATIKARSPEEAMDRADSTFPLHEPVKAIRTLVKEDVELTIIDILDEAMRMTDEQKQKREDIVKGMHGEIAGFKKRYHDKWKDVMYATATKMVMGETVDLESDLSLIEEELVEYVQGHPPIVKKGALHKQEHIKQGVKMGKDRLEKLKAHGTKLEKKRANFALNMNEDAFGIGSDFSDLGETGAKELVFHAMGTPHLQDHQNPYVANMARRMRKGTYDPEKGKKLWGYYADHAAEDYVHEHGGHEQDKHGKKTFPKAVRQEVAAHFEKKHRERMQGGIHEDIEEVDYSSLIDDMRMSIIDEQPLIVEFGNGSEREISEEKINKFLALYDSLDEDDQADLVLIISGSYKTFKNELKEHSTYEQHCNHCGGVLDQHGRMSELLAHIEDHKIPREVAKEAIMRMSRKEVDNAINRNMPVNVPMAGVGMR